VTGTPVIVILRLSGQVECGAPTRAPRLFAGLRDPHARTPVRCLESGRVHSLWADSARVALG